MSSASPSYFNDRLVLEPNVWYERVLKYQTGLSVRGGEAVMFTTMQNEKFFLNNEDAQRLYHLNLRENEPFKIMKRVEGTRGKGQSTDYLIAKAIPEPRRPVTPRSAEELNGLLQESIAETEPRRPAGPRAVARRDQQNSAVPTSNAEPTTTNQPAPHAQINSNQSLTAQMAASYIAAIDALALAEEYAKTKTIAFRATEEAIHTCAHSIFIEYGKAKERSIREREFYARYGGRN